MATLTLSSTKVGSLLHVGSGVDNAGLPVEGCLTVNIGDGLARWTDDVLKSTYHCVRAPKVTDSKGPRYSIPYFANPKLSTVIQGPKKRFEAVTSFDLLAETGKSYHARKGDTGKKAYLHHIESQSPAQLVVA